MNLTLILIPTDFEADFLRPAMRSILARDDVEAKICGFGPIASGIRTAQFVSELRPTNCVLVGIAGAYLPSLAKGSAHIFRKIACYGIGAGSGSQFASAEKMGWKQWSAPIGESHIGDSLTLKSSGPASSDLQLLTVCASSLCERDIEHRLGLFPNAAAEDMEGFSVALACLSSNVPITIVRGISNKAGDRDQSNWDVESALLAAAKLAQSAIELHIS